MMVLFETSHSSMCPPLPIKLSFSVESRLCCRLQEERHVHDQKEVDILLNREWVCHGIDISKHLKKARREAYDAKQREKFIAI